jgi:phenylalanyl-tRNA synthetase beta chain
MIKIPIEWLGEYLSIKLSSDKLSKQLTMAGMEVTSIEKSEIGDVFSLEITPNRADCLSVIGIAREISAFTNAKLKLPKLAGQLARKVPSIITIEDSKDCQLYIGRLLQEVVIGESPEWIKKRLVACGLRPINNVVDITNYVLLECGQPLHAFDYEKISNGKIIVRRAKNDERIVTIDSEERKLKESCLVIADSKKPIALAGIMGGRETEVTSSTRAILLESALFNPIIIRRASRLLGVSSDSSYRFERGVDPEGASFASERAASLICKIASGKAISLFEAGACSRKQNIITLQEAMVERHLGVKLPSSKIKQPLEKLGFGVRKQKNSFLVKAPSFRKDVLREVDLIEDIARVFGYENIQSALPSAVIGSAKGALKTNSYTRTHELRSGCAGLGLSEIMTWALVSEADLSKISFTENALTLHLSNPLSQDHSILRPTLLIGMLNALSRNTLQGREGVRLFELGNVFENVTGAKEKLLLGIGLTGFFCRDWQNSRQSNLFVLKGLLEEVVRSACAKGLKAENDSVFWAQRGECMKLTLNGKLFGYAAQINKKLCEAFDLEHDAWFAEIDADLLFIPKEKKEIAPLGQFPSVKRDVSFIVDKSVAFSKIENTILEKAKPLIQKLELIDRYIGKSIPSEKHSLTISLEYASLSRTLTASEVDSVHESVRAMLCEKLGAQLR